MIKNLLYLRGAFGSKKLGIADTAKVIQDKIMNITQVVLIFSCRMMSNSLVPSSVSAMVLPVWLDSTKFKQERWWNFAQESEVWLLTCKLIMLVLSSSVMIGIHKLIQINPIRRHRHQNWSHCGCAYWRRNVGQSVRCLGKSY